LDRQQRDCDLQESKQQLDIRDRKINVLNRKIENLEDQIRDKSTQITLARAKLTAATTTAATINIQQQTSTTNNTLVSNLETTIGEKERLIEKLREQKHTLDIEHQEEIEQLQKTLNETRLKLEQKEKDYYEGQVRFYFYNISLAGFYSSLADGGTPLEIAFALRLNGVMVFSTYERFYSKTNFPKCCLFRRNQVSPLIEL
jgi:ELKS/RAB6-interacting/CAST family protein 1